MVSIRLRISAETRRNCSASTEETIRLCFYERKGLLPAAQRTENNYHLYTAAHADRRAFIRHCRNLDMALDEIRSRLRLRDAPSQDCGE